jgi:hypothetical protein
MIALIPGFPDHPPGHVSAVRLRRISLVVFEFAFRLDPSRPFLALIAGYSWVFLCLFRLIAGSVVGVCAGSSAGRICHDRGSGQTGAETRRADLERSAQYGIKLWGFGRGPDCDNRGAASVAYKVYPVEIYGKSYAAR